MTVAQRRGVETSDDDADEAEEHRAGSVNCTVRFGTSWIATANAALDVEASAASYLAALRDVLERTFPELVVRVAHDPGTPGIVVECDASDPGLAESVRRDLLDYAWVVRQTMDWPVLRVT